MPGHEWDQMLAEAAGEVLETMFFAGIYGPAEPAADDAEPRLAARLHFEGRPSGALTLSISEAAARALAANFLADEEPEPLPAAQLGSVVGELTNMICGTLLSRVRTEERFRLSTPESLPADWIRPPEAPSQSLDLGEGTIDLWVTVEEHAG